MEIQRRKIVLGVTGSIAAYKAAGIASTLTQAGHDVHVILTRNAAAFIASLTFETLTRNKACVDMFSDEDHTLVTHIDLATTSDLLLVAPATYNILGKVAQGIADDLLSSVLAAAAPQKVLFAPAMHADMYGNPACRANVDTLRARGYSFVEPEEGRLACGAMGKGRLASVESILEAVEAFLAMPDRPLAGRRVLVTAGATREYLDPIRFLSNTSTGRMGVALARVCRNAGAAVTLVLANSALSLDGVRLVRVDTSAEMEAAVQSAFPDADWVLSAAAVSDFRPVAQSHGKIKKTPEGLTLRLALNPDILAGLGSRKTRQKLIGFAAESDDLLVNAASKLARKNLDAIVANGLDNFARETGKVWLLFPDHTIELPEQDKTDLAVDIVRTLLDEGF